MGVMDEINTLHVFEWMSCKYELFNEMANLRGSTVVYRIYRYRHTYIHTYVYTYIHMYKYLYIHMYTRIYTCTGIHK